MAALVSAACTVGRLALPQSAKNCRRILRSPTPRCCARRSTRSTPFDGWSLWGGALLVVTTGPAVIRLDVGSHDLTARTAGVATGLDYRIAPGTVVGFALAGERHNVIARHRRRTGRSRHPYGERRDVGPRRKSCAYWSALALSRTQAPQPHEKVTRGSATLNGVCKQAPENGTAGCLSISRAPRCPTWKTPLPVPSMLPAILALSC